MEGGVKDMEVEEVEEVEEAEVEVGVGGNENTERTLVNEAGIRRVNLHTNKKNVPVKKIRRVKYTQSLAKLNRLSSAATSMHAKYMQKRCRKKVFTGESNITSPKNEVVRVVIFIFLCLCNLYSYVIFHPLSLLM